MISAKNQISVSQVAGHYDLLDDLYYSSWGENLHHGLWDDPSMTKEEAVDHLTRTVAIKAQIQPGDRLCDIGCGYGGAARFFAREYGAQVVGLTLSQKQGDRARLHTSPQVEVRVMDFLENDLSNESFDQAVSIESSEHMPDKAKFFSEAHRILKPKGRFVICAWAAATKLRPWQRQHLIEPICREGQLPQMGTSQDYRQWLEDSGFENIEIQNRASAVQKTWTLALRDLSKHLLQHPQKVHQLLPKYNPEAIFLKSLFRIPLALKTGAMEYLIISATKCENKHSDEA